MLSITVYLLFMEVLLARNFRKDMGPCGSWFSTGSPTLSPVNLLGLAFKGVCTAHDTGRDSIVLRAKGRVPKPGLPLSHSAHSVLEGLASCTLLGEVGCYLFLSRDHLFCWYLLNCGSVPPDFVSSIEMLGATGLLMSLLCVFGVKVSYVDLVGFKLSAILLPLPRVMRF